MSWRLGAQISGTIGVLGSEAMEVWAMSEGETFEARFARKRWEKERENAGKIGEGRRRDYKGLRSRLNLRIPVSLARDLAILATVSDVDKNSFCVEVLEKAVAGQIDRVRHQYGDVAWEVVIRCALGTGEGGKGG